MYKISQYNIIKKYDNVIIAYNSYSKASLILDESSNLDAFENIDSFNKLDEDTKKIMIDNGFIIDSNRNEIDEIKYMYEKKFYDKSFFNIVLVPSLSCNFACPYCFEKNLKCGKENIKHYFKTLKKFASKEFKNHKCVQISLFGGEPLLFYKEFLEFLEWVKCDSSQKQYDYFTSIVTNGSLLTKDMLDNLLLNNLRMLQITIDSDKETHNITRKFKNGTPSFDILIDKIELVTKTISKNDNFNFVLRINLSNTTVEKVEKSLLYINEESRSKINLLFRSIYNTHAYMDDNMNSNDKIYEYLSMGQRLGFNILQDGFKYQSCEACADEKFFYLMPDLTTWKCINDLNYDNACIGKINDDGDLILEPQKNVNWSKNAMNVFNDPQCLSCKLLPDCYGGCILKKCKTCEKQCRPFEMISMYHVFR